MNLQKEEELFAKFEKLPKSKQEEVIDFIDFLNSKKEKLNSKAEHYDSQTKTKALNAVLDFAKEDMADSVEWVNDMRKTQWNQSL